jgi:hypothetical protein
VNTLRVDSREDDIGASELTHHDLEQRRQVRQQGAQILERRRHNVDRVAATDGGVVETAISEEDGGDV